MNQGDDLVPGFFDETDDTLSLDIEPMEGVERGIVVRMSGYLDGFNVVFFSRRVERVLEKGFLFLSFDLGDVSYISSRGIGAFTSFLKALKPRGGNIHLMGARPKVLEVFRILGFLEYFNIGKTREEAGRSFQESSDPISVFPLRSNCPICGQALRIPGAGKGRCPVCKCRMVIDGSGRISRRMP